TGGEEAGEDRVREPDEQHRVGEHRPEVGELGAARRFVQPVAHRVLHEIVGGEDEVGGQQGAGGGGPDGRQVQPAWQAVPAEDPQAEEGRLEEEGEQALDGERGAEDVAHEPGVVAPVHAELELLDDPGHDAHGEVDQEELPVEAGQPVPAVVAGAVPRGLEPGDEEAQADRDRDEQEVVDGRDPELPAREVERVHAPASSAPAVQGMTARWVPPYGGWSRGRQRRRSQRAGTLVPRTVAAVTRIARDRPGEARSAGGQPTVRRAMSTAETGGITGIMDIDYDILWF